MKVSTFELYKDSRKLSNEHCTLLYYGISPKTQLTAVQAPPSWNDTDDRMQIYLQLTTGYLSFDDSS